jgi:uncharacterized integral membrane protein
MGVLWWIMMEKESAVCSYRPEWVEWPTCLVLLAEALMGGGQV